MEFLKAAPEQIGKFVNFVIGFAKGPRATLAAYVQGEAGRPEVSGQLILFCAYSVGCGALVATIGSALGMAEDTSPSLALLRRIDDKLLPLVVAVVVMMASCVWHGLTRLVGAVLGRLMPDLRFTGAVENSMNAGLAVASVFVLALSVLVVGIRVAVPHTTLPWFIYLAPSVALGLGFLIYFVLAFASVHRVEPTRYFVLMAFTVTALRFLTG